MIPRLHRRGNSFKGALGYILHDPGKESSERVAWVETRNIYSDPRDAWFEMFDTYRNRTALKKYNGIELRGRDNKTPVLHYTLSWHASDNPDPEHMKAMALDSLTALGLSEHEAVMACHSDKEHHHVHVVVNTVHPYTGKTAPLKFSKLEFSRWAEAYEKEHGVHCEQRIQNNERRRELAKLREAEREKTALALLSGKRPPKAMPFEPVNNNSPNRRRWFERKDIIDKMKALRAALENDLKTQRGETWAKQKEERGQLDKSTNAKLDQARDGVRKAFQPKWRDLYRAQKKQEHQLRNQVTHPFERAVFVFRNRTQLGDRGTPLSLRQMVPLILSRTKFRDRVRQIHMRARRAMAREEKTLAKAKTQKVWEAHTIAFNALRARQAKVRATERAEQKQARGDISFARAKDELMRASEQAKEAQTKEVRAKEAQTKETLAKVPTAPDKAKPSRGFRFPQPRHLGMAKDVLMQGTPQQGRAPPTVKPKPPPEKQKPERETRPPSKSKQAFKTAAAPIKPRQFKDEKAREEFMKKTMEQWKRRRARDDFERER